MQINNEIYMGSKEAASFLKIHQKTLAAWNRAGLLTPAARTLTNRKVYSRSQLLKFAGIEETSDV